MYRSIAVSVLIKHLSNEVFNKNTKNQDTGHVRPLKRGFWLTDPLQSRSVKIRLPNNAGRVMDSLKRW